MLGWLSVQADVMPQSLPGSSRSFGHTRHVFTALLLALGLAGSLGRPEAARAHAIESSVVRLQALRDTLELQTHFSTGVPVEGAAVRLRSADGRHTLALGRTDSRGALRFQLPAAAGPDWELQVDGGAGHRDYLELPSAPGPQALHPNGPQPVDARDAWPTVAPTALMLVGMLSGGWLWRHRRA